MSVTGGQAFNRPRRLLLITMPLADPYLPNLAVEQLAAEAKQEGHEVDVLYGTLRLPPTVPISFMHGLVAPSIFASAYHGGDVAEFLIPVAEEVVRAISGVSPEAPSVDDVYVRLAEYEYAARQCLDACFEAIAPGRYDVVGFSVGFDSQKLPSAALARRLKQREPDLAIIFGGTGCDGPMSSAILDAFPDIDVCIDGDALGRLNEILGWVRSSQRGSPPAGVINRDVEGKAEPASAVALTEAPDPNYDDFLAQRRRSDYADGPRTLFFETSRGCWWGRKHHCTFCGIKAVRDGWRSVPANEAYRRIETLESKYRPDLHYCVDAILDNEHFEQILPRLAEERQATGRGPNLFYEVKSNLSQRDVALLAAAGVVTMQPGIENFSSRILRQMRKGTTGLNQIALLKWCATYGVELIYGYLAGIPEEKIADVDEAVVMMERLHHLPPPVSVNALGLHRFSPYAEAPERVGITNVRPFALQRLIYRLPDSVLLRLCYELDYDPPWSQDAEHRAAHERLRNAVAIWQARYSRGERLSLVESENGLLCMRTNPDARPLIQRLNEEWSHIYRAIAAPVSEERVAERTGLPLGRVRSVLENMRAQGLTLTEGNRHLALAVPVNRNAFEDAAIIPQMGEMEYA